MIISAILVKEGLDSNGNHWTRKALKNLAETFESKPDNIILWHDEENKCVKIMIKQ